MREHRPSWVRVDRLLGEYGIQEESPAGRGKFEQWMERRRGGDRSGTAQGIAARLMPGGEGFRRELLPRMEGRLGEHHAGELHRASAEAKAERIIAEELERQGWQETDLVTRRRGDSVKLELAARLKRETTLSIKAIAARVGLGSSNAANQSSHDYMRGPVQGGAEVGTGQGNRRYENPSRNK